MDLGRLSSSTGPWSSLTFPNSKDTMRGSRKSSRVWDRGGWGKEWRKIKYRGEKKLKTQQQTNLWIAVTDWKLSGSEAWLHLTIMQLRTTDCLKKKVITPPTPAGTNKAASWTPRCVMTWGIFSWCTSFPSNQSQLLRANEVPILCFCAVPNKVLNESICNTSLGNRSTLHFKPPPKKVNLMVEQRSEKHQTFGFILRESWKSVQTVAQIHLADVEVLSLVKRKLNHKHVTLVAAESLIKAVSLKTTKECNIRRLSQQTAGSESVSPSRSCCC